MASLINLLLMVLEEFKVAGAYMKANLKTAYLMGLEGWYIRSQITMLVSGKMENTAEKAHTFSKMAVKRYQASG